MMIHNFVNNIKSVLDIFPQNDARAKIQSRDLISTLLLSMSKDNRKMSIASLRRSVMTDSLVSVARSSFWQRLAAPSLTRKMQQASLKLISSFNGKRPSPDLEKSIGVKQIFLLDSTTIALKTSAQNAFPGCRTNSAPAALKWHVLFDFSKFEIPWCDVSSGVKNDSLYFPKTSAMIGSLTIFDLGYYNYKRMAIMNKLGMFFLSRIKSNSNPRILKTIEGIPPTCVGKYFTDIHFQENKEYIEFQAEFSEHVGLLSARVIGFWNVKEHKYHWYMTNLECDAKLIFPLYKLRWQIELVFKTVKSSFCIEHLCSANKQIILNLLLLRMCLAFIFFPTIALIFEEMKFKEKITLSIQRAGTMFRWLLPDLKLLIHQTGASADEVYSRLNKKIDILKKELGDPNSRRRKTTISLCFQPQTWV